MNESKFKQERNNWAFIGTQNMLLYRVYNDGSFEMINVPSVQDGLEQIPIIKPELIILKLTAPEISGYELREIETSKDRLEKTLIYVVE